MLPRRSPDPTYCPLGLKSTPTLVMLWACTPIHGVMDVTLPKIIIIIKNNNKREKRKKIKRIFFFYLSSNA